jgi:hypothetical protein
MCGLEAALVVWLLFGVASAIVASKRGRSGCGWFALGFLLGPFGLLFAFVASPNQSRVDHDALKAGTLKKCPSCAELIRQEAVKCRYCGSSVGSNSPAGAAETWRCPKCSTVNSSRVYQCGKCGYSLV